jgi:hypothetical protein
MSDERVVVVLLKGKHFKRRLDHHLHGREGNGNEYQPVVGFWLQR